MRPIISRIASMSEVSSGVAAATPLLMSMVMVGLLRSAAATAARRTFSLRSTTRAATSAQRDFEHVLSACNA